MANIEIEASVREDIENLNKKIAEEKRNPNYDRHKILRLEEQKLMQNLFSQRDEPVGRFRSPW